MNIPEEVSDFKVNLETITPDAIHIKMLTGIVLEHKEFAKFFVKAIETQIEGSNSAQKTLTTFYLLDSIVKNKEGFVYAKEFSKNLVRIFLNSFKRIDKNDISTKKRFLKLLKTWNTIFSYNLLTELDAQLKLIPTFYHGLNNIQTFNTFKVNPKYFFNPVKSVNTNVNSNQNINNPYISEPGNQAIGFQNQPNQVFMTAQNNGNFFKPIGSQMFNPGNFQNGRSEQETPTGDILKQITEAVKQVQENEYTPIIRELYGGFKFFCDCGIRFHFKKDYQEHQQNHYERIANEKLFCRKWFVSADEWVENDQKSLDDVFENSGEIIFGKQNQKKTKKEDEMKDEGEEEIANNYVKYDSNQENCIVCNEPFEKQFDRDKGEWMFCDAVTVSYGGKNFIVHTSCENSVTEENMKSLLGESETSKKKRKLEFDDSEKEEDLKNQPEQKKQKVN